MKSSLELESNPKAVIGWEKFGLGKKWERGNMSRFYFDMHVEDFIEGKIETPFSCAYIDLKTGEYSFTGITEESELEKIDSIISELRAAAKKVAGKKMMSTWTGEEVVCKDIIHLLGEY